MKIRSGFVSNSSSSSFCVIGVILDRGELIEKCGITDDKLTECECEYGNCDNIRFKSLDIYPYESDENWEQFIVGSGVGSTKEDLIADFDNFKLKYGSDGELIFGTMNDGICWSD